MKEEEHDVEWHPCVQLLQHLIAVFLVDRLQRRSGGLGVGEESFHELVAVAHSQLLPQSGDEPGLIITPACGGITAKGSDFRESPLARGPGRKRIALGTQSS